MQLAAARHANQLARIDESLHRLRVHAGLAKELARHKALLQGGSPCAN